MWIGGFEALHELGELEQHFFSRDISCGKRIRYENLVLLIVKLMGSMLRSKEESTACCTGKHVCVKTREFVVLESVEKLLQLVGMKHAAVKVRVPY